MDAQLARATSTLRRRPVAGAHGGEPQESAAATPRDAAAPGAGRSADDSASTALQEAARRASDVSAGTAAASEGASMRRESAGHVERRPSEAGVSASGSPGEQHVGLAASPTGAPPAAKGPDATADGIGGELRAAGSVGAASATAGDDSIVSEVEIAASPPRSCARLSLVLRRAVQRDWRVGFALAAGIAAVAVSYMPFVDGWLASLPPWLHAVALISAAALAVHAARGGGFASGPPPETSRARGASMQLEADAALLAANAAMQAKIDGGGGSDARDPTDILLEEWNLPEPVAQELGTLVRYIRRDFLDSWYQSVGMSDQFGNYASARISNAVGDLCNKIANVNFLQFIFEDAVKALHFHIYWYREMRHRAKQNNPEKFESRKGRDPEDERMMQEQFVMREYAQARVGIGLVHPACGDRFGQALNDPDCMLDAEVAYLRGTSTQLLRHWLPKRDCASLAGNLLLREIIACKVLQPLMSLFAPDMVNSWLVALFETLDAAPASEEAAAAEASSTEPDAGDSAAGEAAGVSASVPPRARDTPEVRTREASIVALEDLVAKIGVDVHADSSDEEGAGRLEHPASIPEDAVSTSYSRRRKGRGTEPRSVTHQSSTRAGVSQPTSPADEKAAGPADSDDDDVPSDLEAGRVVVVDPMGIAAADHDFDEPTVGDDATAGQLHDAGFVYFGGAMTRAAAEAHLAGRPVGCFLFSSGVVGTMRLSYVARRLAEELTGADSESQLQVYHTDVIAVEGNCFEVHDRGKHPSLAALLRAMRDVAWIGLRFEGEDGPFAERLYAHGHGSAAVATSPGGTVVARDLPTTLRGLLVKLLEQKVDDVMAMHEANEGGALSVWSPQVLSLLVVLEAVLNHGLKHPPATRGSSRKHPAYVQFLQLLPATREMKLVSGLGFDAQSKSDSTPVWEMLESRLSQLRGRSGSEGDLNAAKDAEACMCSASSASIAGRLWLRLQLTAPCLGTALEHATGSAKLTGQYYSEDSVMRDTKLVEQVNRLVAVVERVKLIAHDEDSAGSDVGSPRLSAHGSAPTTPITGGAGGSLGDENPLAASDVPPLDLDHTVHIAKSAHGDDGVIESGFRKVGDFLGVTQSIKKRAEAARAAVASRKWCPVHGSFPGQVRRRASSRSKAIAIDDSYFGGDRPEPAALDAPPQVKDDASDRQQRARGGGGDPSRSPLRRARTVTGVFEGLGFGGGDTEGAEGPAVSLADEDLEARRRRRLKREVTSGNLGGQGDGEDSGQLQSGLSADGVPVVRSQSVGEAMAHERLFASVVSAAIKTARSDSGVDTQVVLYEVAVRSASGGTWSVWRRYSHFHALHELLKELYGRPPGRFPGKRVLSFKSTSKSFVKSRQRDLDAYLQALLSHSGISRSVELKGFLYPHEGDHRLDDPTVADGLSALLTQTKSALTPVDDGAAGSSRTLPAVEGGALAELHELAGEASDAGAESAPEMTASSSAGDTTLGAGGASGAAAATDRAEAGTAPSRPEGSGSAEGTVEDGGAAAVDASGSGRSLGSGGADKSAVDAAPALPTLDEVPTRVLHSGSTSSAGASSVGGAAGGGGGGVGGATGEQEGSGAAASPRRDSASSASKLEFPPTRERSRSSVDRESELLLKARTYMSSRQLSDAKAASYDLIRELFELRNSGWIRRGVLGVTHSIFNISFGGTVVKLLRRVYAQAASLPSLTWLSHWVVDILWPGGQLLPAMQPPTVDEKYERAKLVRERMMTLFPLLLTSLVGKDSADTGCSKLHLFLQNPVMLRSLAYTLVDLLLARIYGDLQVHGQALIAQFNMEVQEHSLR